MQYNTNLNYNGNLHKLGYNEITMQYNDPTYIILT